VYAVIAFDSSETLDQIHESGEIDASMSATTDANPFFDPESVPAELPVATIPESPLSAIETQVLPSFEIVSVESGTDLPPSDLPEPPLDDSSIASSEVRNPVDAMIDMPEQRDVEPVSIAGAEESLESNEKPLIEVIAESKEPAQESARKPADDFEFMIEFENVTKRFRNQTVLRDLTFRVPRGQTVCLIGESGCGKTVNLKLMIGLMRPDQGRVSFKGEDLARMNEKKITATRIKFGFLFQMAALFDSMSIYDNVAFGLREHRLVDEKDLPDYIRERLTEVGLPQGVESKKPAELSGGQRKRVGLARALALKPEVMLYDEPTTGLDPIMTDIINELILQTQADRSRSGIIVTHEMRTVTKCADRVIMLYPISRLEPDEPQILYDGPADGLEDHPDIRVRQFVRGEAGERLRELNPDRLSEDPASGIVPMDPDEIVKARPPRRY
jgi:phospholipid/cholesterol/gamma-HCH transport system ATP-binding protein